jgi:hypothetical protein
MTAVAMVVLAERGATTYFSRMPGRGGKRLDVWRNGTVVISLHEPKGPSTFAVMSVVPTPENVASKDALKRNLLGSAAIFKANPPLSNGNGTWAHSMNARIAQIGENVAFGPTDEDALAALLDALLASTEATA